MTIDFSSTPTGSGSPRERAADQTHPRRPIRRALFVPIMTVLFTSTAWSGSTGEPDTGDLVSMMDHAAIVETMASACENSRPDLAKPFKEAEQLWWVRNAQIHETLASLEREIGMPRAKAFLDYFNTLQRSLRQQIEEERRIGNVRYATRCDGVLEDLTHGRLDYRSSLGASGAG